MANAIVIKLKAQTTVLLSSQRNECITLVFLGAVYPCLLKRESKGKGCFTAQIVPTQMRTKK